MTWFSAVEFIIGGVNLGVVFSEYTRGGVFIWLNFGVGVLCIVVGGILEHGGRRNSSGP